MRNFGLTSGPTLGAQPPTRSHHAQTTQRDSIQSAKHPPVWPDLRGKVAPSFIIPGSILIPEPTIPPFKRSQIVQACIDGICVVFGFIFLCSVVASLPLAVVIMFMVVR